MKSSNDSSVVLYEKSGPVAYITLNRPKVLNAMNLEMHEQLKSVWDDFESDDDIRLGILSGSGEKAFSVGQDLKELSALNRTNEAEESSFGSVGKPGWPRLTERFERVKPLIAKISGYALGGGFELALACDIIVADEYAQFALPEAKLGLIPGAGGLFRLSRQIPYRTAVGYLITGRRMEAKTAWRLGLINDVVPKNKLDACVNSWAQDILSCAPLSIRAIKEAVAKASTMSLEEAFSSQYLWEQARKSSDDAKEGPLAFSERRKPVWQGH